MALGIVLHNKNERPNGWSINSKLRNKYETGDNVLISQLVTIGDGAASIGNKSVIGANAVVVHDIPNNSLAVGVPAKIIKSNIVISDYK